MKPLWPQRNDMHKVTGNKCNFIYASTISDISWRQSSWKRSNEYHPLKSVVRVNII
jgi:hypothetical protein